MIELDKNNFEAEVLQAEGTVLVDYYGATCEPCLALMPHVHALADTYGASVKFTKLDIGKSRRLAINQKILGLPAICIYKGGEKVEELVKDDATASSVEEMVKKYL